MSKRLMTVLTLGFVLVIDVSFVSSGPMGPLLEKDANNFVMQEVHTSALANAAVLLGADPNNSLPWSGTIADTGWTYHLSAPYRDGSLTMDYSGTLDRTRDLISWSGTGVFGNSEGSVEWSEAGSYDNATEDGFWKKLANFALKVIKPFVPLIVREIVSGVESVVAGVSAGSLGPVIFGVSPVIVEKLTPLAVNAVNTLIKETDGKTVSTVSQSPTAGQLLNLCEATEGPGCTPVPSPIPEGFTNLLRREEGEILVESQGQLIGNYSDAVVSVSGIAIVSAVSAPSTLFLLLAGGGLLGGTWFRRWSQKDYSIPPRRGRDHSFRSTRSIEHRRAIGRN